MILNNWSDAKMEIDFLILVVLGRESDWVGLMGAQGLRQLVPRHRSSPSGSC
jgi:hypothetical protein